MKQCSRMKFVFILFVCIGQLSAQTKLIEKVTKKGNELVIPYEKYQLTNGLILIIHEDHSDPIVNISVLYHVGSAREQEGRSGFAHFFEHMMFEGSEHIAAGEHHKIIDEVGGELNGITTRDVTEYFDLVPSNQLETVLWLESDRMGFFSDSITEQKFKIQREVVKNERAEKFDNMPYGLMNEKICEALYPHTHPYSWPTIGYVGDLDNVTVSDLKNFFTRWYCPNNATLTIAGDVNPSIVVKLVDKYFSAINPGKAINPPTITPITLDNNRYVSFENKVIQPEIIFTFPTIPNRHLDEAPLDILAEILGEGKTSVFYQYFVKSGDADALEITHPCFEISGEFSIKIRANRLKNFDKILIDAFAEFEKKGISEEDLKKYKSRYEFRKTDQLQSVKVKASLLAYYQTHTGNPNYISKDFERYNNVTTEDIMRVYKKYIKDKYSVILSIVPIGSQQLISRNNNFQRPRNKNTTESQEYMNLTYLKPKDVFDRKKRPIPAPAPLVKVPDFWIDSLENGLKIIGCKSDELPTSIMKISIEKGNRFENKENAGITELLTAMLKESTDKSSSEQIDLRLNQLGSHINIVCTCDEINFYISSLTKNFDSTLAILEEIILHPKFDPVDFERVQVKQVELINGKAFNSATFPNELITQLMFGKNNILGNSSKGTRETIARLSAKELKEYYEKNCVPSIASLVFVGNLSKVQVMEKLAFLKNWKDSKVVLSDLNSAPFINKTSIYFLNKANASQSEIRIASMEKPYDAIGDYYKTSIAKYVLGGSYNSRINLNLRQQHGYCYSARSSCSSNKYSEPYIIKADVKSSVTDSAVIELMKEIKNYSDKGISKEELIFTQNSMGQEEVLKYETPFQKADFLKMILDHKLQKDFTIKQNSILKNIKLDEINTIAKNCLPYNNMMILIIGNKSQVLSKLTKLGYEVNEINFLGDVLNTY